MKAAQVSGYVAWGTWANWITGAQVLQQGLSGGGLVLLTPAVNLGGLTAPTATGGVATEVYRFDDEQQLTAPVVMEVTYRAVVNGANYGLGIGVRLASRYDGTLTGAGATRYVAVSGADNAGMVFASSSENGALFAFGSVYACNLWVSRLAAPHTDALTPDVMVALRTSMSGADAISEGTNGATATYVRFPTLNLEQRLAAWPAPLLNTTGTLSADGAAFLLNGPVLNHAGRLYSLLHRRALIVGLSGDAINTGSTQDVTLGGVTGTYAAITGLSTGTTQLALSSVVRSLVRLT